MRRPSAKNRTRAKRLSPPSLQRRRTSATVWRSEYATTAPAFRPRSGTRCSIPSSRQNRLERALVLAVHHSRHRRQATFGIDGGGHPARRVYRGSHRSAARSVFSPAMIVESSKMLIASLVRIAAHHVPVPRGRLLGARGTVETLQAAAQANAGAVIATMRR
jgi:hypothetical protein